VEGIAPVGLESRADQFAVNEHDAAIDAIRSRKAPCDDEVVLANDASDRGICRVGIEDGSLTPRGPIRQGLDRDVSRTMIPGAASRYVRCPSGTLGVGHPTPLLERRMRAGRPREGEKGGES
jgi:hypothetical protein